MVAAIGRAVAHAAEADARYVEAGAAEFHIFHRLSRSIAYPAGYRIEELGPPVRGKPTERAEIGWSTASLVLAPET